MLGRGFYVLLRLVNLATKFKLQRFFLYLPYLHVYKGGA